MSASTFGSPWPLTIVGDRIRNPWLTSPLSGACKRDHTLSQGSIHVCVIGFHLRYRRSHNDAAASSEPQLPLLLRQFARMAPKELRVSTAHTKRERTERAASVRGARPVPPLLNVPGTSSSLGEVPLQPVGATLG